MKTSMFAVAILLSACCSNPKPQPAASTPPPPPPQSEVAPPAQIDTRPSGKPIIIPSAPATFRSKTILHELINGRPENVVTDFNAEMKAALPADKLKTVWNDLLTKMGPYQSMGEPTQTEEQGYKVVYVPLTFEKGTLRAKLVYDQSNYVGGLWFVP